METLETGQLNLIFAVLLHDAGFNIIVEFKYFIVSYYKSALVFNENKFTKNPESNKKIII